MKISIKSILIIFSILIGNVCMAQDLNKKISDELDAVVLKDCDQIMDSFMPVIGLLENKLKDVNLDVINKYIETSAILLNRIRQCDSTMTYIDGIDMNMNRVHLTIAKSMGIFLKGIKISYSNNYSKAIELVEKSIIMYPLKDRTKGSLYFSLGELYNKNGNKNRACECWKKGSDLGSSKASSAYNGCGN
ncbi:MAG: hypothetical protein N4A72_02240 [Bacteroidales bacterium]|jgi:tetratricopeptide (TPR) repeat protein|nr:hypothetical protein [Bacteroidales bacterium]